MWADLVVLSTALAGAADKMRFANERYERPSERIRYFEL
jgi:hypothetical protein